MSRTHPKVSGPVKSTAVSLSQGNKNWSLKKLRSMETVPQRTTEKSHAETELQKPPWASLGFFVEY
jgi:hypothetical protein